MACLASTMLVLEASAVRYAIFLSDSSIALFLMYSLVMLTSPLAQSAARAASFHFIVSVIIPVFKSVETVRSDFLKYWLAFHRVGCLFGSIHACLASSQSLRYIICRRPFFSI